MTKGSEQSEHKGSGWAHCADGRLDGVGEGDQTGQPGVKAGVCEGMPFLAQRGDQDLAQKAGGEDPLS
jgi:hypothetical protein